MINSQMMRHLSGLGKGKWHLTMYCLWQQPLKQNARLLIRGQKNLSKQLFPNFLSKKIGRRLYEIKYSDIHCSLPLVLMWKVSYRRYPEVLVGTTTQWGGVSSGIFTGSTAFSDFWCLVLHWYPWLIGSRTSRECENQGMLKSLIYNGVVLAYNLCTSSCIL